MHILMRFAHKFSNVVINHTSFKITSAVKQQSNLGLNKGEH